MSQEAVERIRWEVIWILIVLAVTAIVLLPLGRGALLWEIARAFMVLWGVLLMAAWLMQRLQTLLRIEDDPPSDAYILTNLAVGVTLLVVWTGYAALLIRDSAQGAPLWMAAILYVIGLLASHAAFGTVSVIYGGSIYRTVHVFVALGGYVLFALWPPAARAAFGWLT
jgi:hypothetical protein